MLEQLKQNLRAAQGRSEFVIVVFCDIRAFSNFSAARESPDIAMFIKRFYLRLLDDYFPAARFAKPTGDGLLLAFEYSEETLLDVAGGVVLACFKALSDFEDMFRRDPMINFSTPRGLGFGICRGTACCLYSNDTIIDYSGRLINLASRLNDLARPKGIVIDGSFMMEAIPSGAKASFREESVFVRALAETHPMRVYCSSDVVLSESALFPIIDPGWVETKKCLSVREWNALNGSYNLLLPQVPRSASDIRAKVRWPNTDVPGHSRWIMLKDVSMPQGKNVRVSVSMNEIRAIIAKKKLSQELQLTLSVEFVPRLPSKSPEVLTTVDPKAE